MSVNTFVPIEGSSLVAAVTLPRSKAAFNRAHLIVRAPDGTLVQARAYGSDKAMGPGLTDEEVRELVAAEQVLQLPLGIPLESGAALWVLRHRFPRRDRALHELEVSGLLTHPPLDGPDDAWLCVVNEAAEDAARLRDRWRDEAQASAESHARHGDWPRAEHDAQVAHAVSRGLDAEILALLSLAHERCGRDVRARALSIVARRSRGEEFEAQVEAALQRLRVALLDERRRFRQ
jgi:hypothetical protein